MPAERTHLTTHMHTIADTLRAAFGRMKLGDYELDMTVPEQTTNGGRLALQHVRLRPKNGLAIVVGTVDVVNKTVELRTYELVSRMCVQRFKRAPSFDAASYHAFIERAEAVFANFLLEVRLTNVGSIAPPAPPTAASWWQPGELLTSSLVFAGVLASALALSFFR